MSMSRQRLLILTFSYVELRCEGTILHESCMEFTSQLQDQGHCRLRLILPFVLESRFLYGFYSVLSKIDSILKQCAFIPYFLFVGDKQEDREIDRDTKERNSKNLSINLR
jgi:hypothetical protein